MFQNLMGHQPVPAHTKDNFLLCCIQRVNLDALWGQESATVSSTLRAMRQLLQAWCKVGIDPYFPPMKPFPVEDLFGVRIAIGMIMESLEPGKYAGYQQFESIRKLHASFSNIYMAPFEGFQSFRSSGGEVSKNFLNHNPTQSSFFQHFSQGCVRRMGQEVHQDWAIQLPVMHALIDALEQDWRVSSTLQE